jgi:hypothetical protein
MHTRFGNAKHTAAWSRLLYDVDMQIKTHAITAMADDISISKPVLYLAPKSVAVCRHFQKTHIHEIIVFGLHKICNTSFSAQPRCHLGFTISSQIVQCGRSHLQVF